MPRPPKSSASSGTHKKKSKNVSPELTGGSGFTFEDAVAAVYVAALLMESTAPGLPGRTVSAVSLQQAVFDHPLDDLVVDAISADGSPMQMGLQIKRSITLTAAESNTDFRETITRAHRTVTKDAFRLGTDRVGMAVGEVAEAPKRALETLCEWARSHSSPSAFLTLVNTEGAASRLHRTIVDSVRNALATVVDEPELDGAVHRLLAHLLVLRFDLLHEGSQNAADVVARLQEHLRSDARHSADGLWNRLLAIVRDSQGRAATLNRTILVDKLNGAFKLVGAPSLQANMNALRVEAQFAASEIANEISGARVSRQRRVDLVNDALVEHRLVQVSGMPGAGKSAVLRTLIDAACSQGSVLCLKADRLVGTSWSMFASSMGLTSGSLEDLLVEIGATGTAVLFIDGLDRVEVKNRGVINDVLSTLMGSSLLTGWKIVATVRDNGLEPLRTWLPSSLLQSSGTSVVEVGSFDDHESEELAVAKPHLRPLLFGDPRVREIVRRPFFASILSRWTDVSATPASSEIELASAWWTGGGYGAATAEAGIRRELLIELARLGAGTLGRQMPIYGLNQNGLDALVSDDVVRFVRVGHTVRFTHDIYFEWSFLQYLVAQGERWTEALKQCGEPPVLGRTVELLSQNELLNGSWSIDLARLEANKELRSQWLRAWMVGPLSLPGFQKHEAVYSDAMLEPGSDRTRKLAVWFQAEKTKANPLVLGGQASSDMKPDVRLRVADQLAWPSDVASWERLCIWLIKHIDRIPVAFRPDVVTVFEVWQNVFSDYAHPVSKQIHDLTKKWLLDLEEKFHEGEYPRDHGEWSALERGEEDGLEERLRVLLLRSGRAFRASVGDYLKKLQSKKRVWRKAAADVLAFSPILAEVQPKGLADLMLARLMRELPEVAIRKERASRHFHGFSHHDWDGLALDDNYTYFPASPLREPFHSLFKHDPSEAIRLLKELSNHATTAWRQLHRLDPGSHAVPVPLVLEFPWGRQEFWGDQKVYAWSRGSWGPHVVESGLMAIEDWAVSAINGGRSADEVLRQIVEGHESIAILSVAAAIALEFNTRSTTTLPLATNQRLWGWDIARMVAAGSRANLIGFQSESDARHHTAVAESNQRASRRLELRGLAMIFVLGNDDLAAAASAEICAFPDNLPVSWEEERLDEPHMAGLLRTAEIWAELGKRENYKLVASDNDSKVLVQLENPLAKGPDIDAIRSRQDRMVQDYTLLNWVHETLEHNVLSASLTLEEAIRRAREIDSNDLFEGLQGIGDPDSDRRSAISGVAAVLLKFGTSAGADDTQWAGEICSRASAVQDDVSDHFFSGSVLLHHPALYAAIGFSALLNNGDLTAASHLVRLVGHRYEQVSLQAMRGLIEAWPTSSNVAWIGLTLGIEMSVVVRRSESNNRNPTREAIALAAEKKALKALTDLDSTSAPLPKLSPPWVVEARKSSGKATDIQDRPNWRTPDIDLNWSLLPKIIKLIPVSHALSDPDKREMLLSWSEGLVAWLIERLQPSWAAGTEDKSERGSVDMFEMRSNLFQYIAGVSRYLEASESLTRFLEPTFAANDKVAASLLRPYVRMLTCTIMDEPAISLHLLNLLKECAARILRHGEWRRANWNEGKIYDDDLMELTRSFFFVAVGPASRASRFANGDWADVSIVLPFVDAFTESVGESVGVIDAFVSLCERSLEFYPPEAFIKQLMGILDRSSATPPGWRGTTIPNRLATLIQGLSQKRQPLPQELALLMLRALDRLVDMGDRRAAAIQTSEIFKDVRMVVH